MSQPHRPQQATAFVCDLFDISPSLLACLGCDGLRFYQPQGDAFFEELVTLQVFRRDPNKFLLLLSFRDGQKQRALARPHRGESPDAAPGALAGLLAFLESEVNRALWRDLRDAEEILGPLLVASASLQRDINELSQERDRVSARRKALHAPLPLEREPEDLIDALNNKHAELACLEQTLPAALSAVKRIRAEVRYRAELMMCPPRPPLRS